MNPCVGNKREVDLADYGLPMSNVEMLRPALSPDDRQNAINVPTAGWSSYRTRYGANHPSPLQYAALRTSPLPQLGPGANYIREWGADIASRAPAAAGAENAWQSEWWMMKENGMPCTPMAGLDFVVYRPRGRVTRRHRNRPGP